MGDGSNGELDDFASLLVDVKERILSAQTRAVLAVNAELVRLYWEIGRSIHERQRSEGWGAAVIPRLSSALKNELPEVKGFSERNIKRMLAFYREYPEVEGGEIVPQAVAQTTGRSSALETGAHVSREVFWAVPWAHHIIMIEKIKHLPTRFWYMEQTLAHGWSRNVLIMQIETEAHVRQGKAVTNFSTLLPSPQSDLAQQALKDPYIFDFLTLEEPFHERELEISLVHHLEKFLLELGQGFAFVGRQYRLDVGGEDFYIDLLFYHLRLRAFIVIDLKRGKFRPEYAGKLNFYCNVVNDLLRHPDDQPTIGLILCQSKDNLLAEYSISGIDKPIGISTYELTRALPTHLRSALPTVEEIERELAEVQHQEEEE